MLNEVYFSHRYLMKYAHAGVIFKLTEYLLMSNDFHNHARMVITGPIISFRIIGLHLNMETKIHFLPAQFKPPD